MYTLENWNINELVYESPGSLVYRGTGKLDSKPVFLKILKEDYPSPNERIKYHQEYEITRQLHLPGVIQVYSQEKYGNSLAIVLEDFGGDSLKILKKKKEFSVTEVTRLGIQITKSLKDIHANNVIHKDINPSNIVYNPKSGELKIIDFGVSTKLSNERPEVINPEHLEGTLAYMSPEQTGRMNRNLDYRTDFYALGATLFELLTERPPFLSPDPMVLVHAHLAREPDSPQLLNPKIPRNLAQIILKLLAKRAEDRYQSAEGIISDLEFSLTAAGKNKDFIPGQKDAIGHFTLPQKLYGRETELEQLLNTAARATIGTAEILMIAGYSGVGKSALVKELHKPLAVRRGYFITGKFDQYHRNIPYSAVQNAFQDLLRQIMTESQYRISNWKDEILETLGPNARVISEFLPELEKIIGEMGPVTELDATAERNRFNLSLRKFIRIFCTEKHPLVIFLDDLQWADPASLNLIENLLIGGRYLFIIGAYRENEVSAPHPLLRIMSKMREENIPLSTIVLKPLKKVDVRSYIIELTKDNSQAIDELADLVKEKTNGNPFFMGELLKNLFRKKILRYNTEQRNWSCDSRLLRKEKISQNVIEFMSSELEELESESREALARAACLGNVFELSSLAMNFEKSEGETASALWPALSRGLIQPLNNQYKIATLKDKRRGPVFYRFTHDRIQEAAYSLIPEDERPALQLQAGRLLFAHADTEKLRRGIFKIVDHLNMGAPLMKDPWEREGLAKLNLKAGRKAQSSTAYVPALLYFRQGLELLGVEGREKEYELGLMLFIYGTEAAYLSQNYEVMEELAAKGTQFSRNILDQVKFEEIRIKAYHARNDPKQAYYTGLKTLNKLGFKIPDNPSKIRILASLFYTFFRILRKSHDSLLNLPPMTDPVAKAGSRIISSLTMPVLSFKPELIPMFFFHIIKLTLKHGTVRETPFSYAFCGMLIISILKSINKGFNFGLLSLELIEKFDLKEVQAQVNVIFLYTINHWKKHLKESYYKTQGIFQVALEHGDIQYAALSGVVSTLTGFYSGRNLPELFKKSQEYIQSLNELGEKNSLYRLGLYGRTVALLLNPKGNFEPLQPDTEIQTEQLTLANIHFCNLTLAFLFRNIEQTIHHIREAKKYLLAARGHPAIPLLYYYESLAYLAGYETSTRREQGHIRRLVKKNQKKLKFWSNHAPMNQLHRYNLVAAEEARVLGKTDKARGFYESAIQLARENDYLNDEALAWELGGRFYIEKQQPEFARFYLRNAHYNYGRWGTKAVQHRLEQEYPRDFTSKVRDISKREEIRDGTIDGQISSTGESGTLGSRGLELNAIMKASLAIAGEMDISDLMRKLMQVVLENTGASQGYLLIKKEGQLFVEAHARAETQEVELLDSRPMKSVEEIPSSLVAYVLRSGEALVLDDAAENELFKSDPAIRDRRPRSVLSYPIEYGKQIIGLLYLENNLTTRAFTPTRLKILRLLSTQIAISLKNSLNYEALRKANKVKSLFLNKMNHELRTPLNSILGSARNLSEDRDSKYAQDKRLDEILKSGGRLRSLIENLLDLSTENSPELLSEKFELKALFVNLVYHHRDHAKQKKLSFEHVNVTPMPDEARGDSLRLEKILNNILDNAVKYTLKGGIILRTSYTEGTLHCEIEDSGPGISPEQESRLFSPFQELGENQEESEGSGLTGMGLSVARRLVEILGGQLSLKSKPEQGSLFILEIPLSAESPIANKIILESEELTSTLLAPPLESLQELDEMVKQGDISAILDYAEALEQKNPEFSNFAREIQNMARGFKERQLAEFVRHRLDAAASTSNPE